MVPNPALSINPAHPWTRVDTFEILACPVRRAFGICGALRPTGYVGVSKISSDTLAAGGVPLLGTLGVYAARRRVARVQRFC